MRIGIGYDIHRLKKGLKLRLGGVTVPHTHGLEGHSDGDALLHAIVDALLGAAGLGDIGGYFSDKDPRFKNVDSRFFLNAIREMLSKKKWEILNVDAVIIAEKPNLSAFKKAICRNIAGELGISASQVNVKAKTNEGLGPVGKGKAIACYAVAALERKS